MSIDLQALANRPASSITDEEIEAIVKHLRADPRFVRIESAGRVGTGAPVFNVEIRGDGVDATGFFSIGRIVGELNKPQIEARKRAEFEAAEAQRQAEAARLEEFKKTLKREEDSPVAVENVTGPRGARYVAVSFEKHELALERVRMVPGRKWDPDNKRWLLPPSDARQIDWAIADIEDILLGRPLRSIAALEAKERGEPVPYLPAVDWRPHAERISKEAAAAADHRARMEARRQEVEALEREARAKAAAAEAERRVLENMAREQRAKAAQEAARIIQGATEWRMVESRLVDRQGTPKAYLIMGDGLEVDITRLCQITREPVSRRVEVQTIRVPVLEEHSVRVHYHRNRERVAVIQAERPENAAAPKVS